MVALHLRCGHTQTCDIESYAHASKCKHVTSSLGCFVCSLWVHVICVCSRWWHCWARWWDWDDVMYGELCVCMYGIWEPYRVQGLRLSIPCYFKSHLIMFVWSSFWARFCHWYFSREHLVNQTSALQHVNIRTYVCMQRNFTSRLDYVGIYLCTLHVAVVSLCTYVPEWVTLHTCIQVQSIRLSSLNTTVYACWGLHVWQRYV